MKLPSLLLAAALAAGPSLAAAPGPYVLVLGTAQDGGIPHLGAHAAADEAARRDPSLARTAASLLVVDPASGRRWLIDATPDVARQLESAAAAAPLRAAAEGRAPILDGVFLTHAHVGHYLGLAWFGREIYGADRLPVHGSARMVDFLARNAPWELLVRLGHVELRTLAPGHALDLAPGLTITPFMCRQYGVSRSSAVPSSTSSSRKARISTGARSRVLEYLQSVRNKLPADVNPVLGPAATSLGWGFSYALVDQSGEHDLSRLRSLQDWNIKLALESVPGVSQVASVGGFVRQYQVTVEPNRLAAYGISLMKVMDAVRKSNIDVEGRVLELAGTEYMVRGRGYVTGVKDLQEIAVGAGPGGSPVFLRDVARRCFSQSSSTVK